MSYIFHIVDKKDWELAKKHGVYSPASLNIEGFIHCSKIDQILTVANSFYKNQSNLLLLKIKEDLVKNIIKHEPPLEAPFSEIYFPHIYGDLNLDAVEKEINFPPREDGKFELPESIF